MIANAASPATKPRRGHVFDLKKPGTDRMSDNIGLPPSSANLRDRNQNFRKS